MNETTISLHLVSRLRELEVDCGFGIVGDFALRLFAALTEDGFPLLITSDEQGAGFASDAYARLRGFGVVAVTYGVGGLKITNAVAGAWAEQVPLLVISGAPGIAERANDPMLHHKVKDFDTQARVFADLTVAQAVLDDPRTAADEIDRVIEAVLAHQRPGYIEVPRDMVGVAISPPTTPPGDHRPRVDPERLAAAVADIIDHLQAAQTPVIQVGAMAWRRLRGIGDHLVEFAERTGIPVATSSLAKGLFPERHPLSLGVYMGAVSSPDVVDRVEQADLLISVGVLNTDLTMGAFTAHRSVDRLIECTDTDVTVGLRTYRDVPLWALIPALASAMADTEISIVEHTPRAPQHNSFTAQPGTPLTVERFIAAVGSYLDDRHGVLVDPGECLFASVDLIVPHWCLASAYYATMGYAVPASLGAGMADPAVRPVVLVGDGAFAMTGMEVASAALHGVHPIVIVLDNNGYGTQRPMLDGPFNDIAPLAVEHLPAVLGTGQGWRVETEDELDSALRSAVDSAELAIIRVIVPRDSRSAALTRLTDALSTRV
jgi:TPP-dependent 2-oxoacid decarboxylase